MATPIETITVAASRRLPERNAGRTEAYPHAKVPDDGRDHDAEQPAGDHSPFTLVPIECVETDVRERHDPNSNNPGRRDADRLEEPRCDRVFSTASPSSASVSARSAIEEQQRDRQDVTRCE